MTEHTQATEERWDPTREDILIGRVTDGEASPMDWGELEQLAGTDPQLWARLAQAQRAHARFARVVDEQVSIAELVELPEAPIYQLSIWQRTARFGGWAAAAALAIAWGINAPAGPGEIAGIGPSFVPARPTADQAYADYLQAGMDEGRVWGELTPQVIESHPIEGTDRYETVIIRRIVERSEVTGAVELRVTVDELGRREILRRPAALETWVPDTARATGQKSAPAMRPRGGAI